MADSKAPYYALYGNTRILKAFCEVCKRFAFVIRGELQCCDSAFEGAAQKYKRETQPENKRVLAPLKFRKEQLERQENRCFYCDRSLDTTVLRGLKRIRLRLHWDHVIPFSYAQDNRSINFVAACHVCNGIKSAFCFQTVEEAKVYILGKWDEKGYV